jgi:hypothetical protein
MLGKLRTICLDNYIRLELLLCLIHRRIAHRKLVSYDIFISIQKLLIILMQRIITKTQDGSPV